MRYAPYAYECPEPEPTVVPYWHLVSTSTDYEDYAFTEPELTELISVYSELGTFTVEQCFKTTD